MKAYYNLVVETYSDIQILADRMSMKTWMEFVAAVNSELDDIYSHVIGAK